MKLEVKAVELFNNGRGWLDRLVVEFSFNVKGMDTVVDKIRVVSFNLASNWFKISGIGTDSNFVVSVVVDINAVVEEDDDNTSVWVVVVVEGVIDDDSIVVVVVSNEVLGVVVVVVKVVVVVDSGVVVFIVVVLVVDVCKYLCSFRKKIIKFEFI